MRERHVWIAVTAVLATSLLWLGAASVVLLAGACGNCLPGAVAVLRAVGHAALAAGRLGWPVLLAALASTILLLAATLRPAKQPARSGRHV
jgi:hypothetical protein